MSITFSQSPDDRNLYLSNWRDNAPHFYWRENQRLYELYYPGVIRGSMVLKTHELTLCVMDILVQHFAPGRKIQMPLRGDVAKADLRKKYADGKRVKRGRRKI